jgi:hypothetical protein
MKALTSRTVITLFITFITNGFMAISGEFSPEVVLIVNAILGLVAGYFKLNPSQDYTK